MRSLGLRLRLRSGQRFQSTAQRQAADPLGLRQCLRPIIWQYFRRDRERHQGLLADLRIATALALQALNRIKVQGEIKSQLGLRQRLRPQPGAGYGNYEAFSDLLGRQYLSRRRYILAILPP
jgi:hypothetical protein